MNFLPPELLEHIFKFLPISALGTVAQVCKTWRDLAYDDEVWEEAYVRRWGKDDALTQATIPTVPKSKRGRFIGRYILPMWMTSPCSPLAVDSIGVFS